MKGIVSRPPEDNYVYATNFSSLAGVKNSVANQTCTTPATPIATTTTTPVYVPTTTITTLTTTTTSVYYGLFHFDDCAYNFVHIMFFNDIVL